MLRTGSGKRGRAGTGMGARNHIEVVEKAIRVLEILAEGEGSKSLREISAEAGLVKSTAYRLLFTLRALGYVERNEARGTYSLNLKILALAHGAKAKATLTRVAQPHLAVLRDRLDESVWLAELRAGEVYLVDVAEAHHALRLLLKLGDPCPLHAAAAGKAVAAYLDAETLSRKLVNGDRRRFTPRTLTSLGAIQADLALVRERGYAINDEETVEGAIALGAPVFDAGQNVCGAISVTAPVSRWKSGRIQETGLALKDCAETISHDLLSLDFEVSTGPRRGM